MDADVERFFDECRADGLCRDNPENFDPLMEILETFYLEADESASFQEFWDDIREIAAGKEPRMERLSEIEARLKSIYLAP
jgi:hypothetical protein